MVPVEANAVGGMAPFAFVDQKEKRMTDIDEVAQDDPSNTTPLCIDCDRTELLAVLRKKGGSIVVFGDESPDGSAFTSGVEVARRLLCETSETVAQDLRRSGSSSTPNALTNLAIPRDTGLAAKNAGQPGSFRI